MIFLTAVLVVQFQIGEKMQKPLTLSGCLLNPAAEFLLHGAFLVQYMKLADGTVHTDAVLPIIGDLIVFGSIFDAHLVALQHRVFPNRLLDATHFDARLVAILDTLLHTP